MEKARGRNGLKWLGLSILVFVLLFQLVAWNFLDPILENSIKAHVHSSSQGRYVVESLNVDSDIVRGTFFLKNIRFRSDSAQVESLMRAGDSSTQNIHLDIGQIQIDGLNAFMVYIGKRLSLSRIHIQHPILEWRDISPHNSPDSTTRRNTPAILLAGFFRSVNIGELVVEDGAIRFPTDSVGSPSLEGITFRSRDWHIDSLSDSWAQVLRRSTLELAENDYSFLLARSAAVIRAGKASYDTRRSEIHIEDLQFGPDAEDGRQMGYPGERLEVRVEDLMLSGLELDQLLTQSLRRIERISVSQPEIQLFGEQAFRVDTPSDSLRLPAFFKGIDIGEFEIDNGAFTWFMDNGDSLAAATIRHISLVPGQSDDLLKRLLYAQVDMHLAACRLVAPAAGYVLSGQSADFSSETGVLSIINFSVIPAPSAAMKQNQVADAVEIRIPELEIGGWHPPSPDAKGWRWESVVLNEPRMLLPGNWGAADEDKSKRPSWMRKIWEVDRFQVKNGQVATNDSLGNHHLSAHSLNLDIKNLRAGALVQHQGYFPLDARAIHFDLAISTYRHVAPDSSLFLELSDLIFSDRDSLIKGKAANLRLLPVSNDSFPDSSGFQHLTLEVPDWEISGLRLLDLLRNRQLQASRLTLRAPDIQVTSTALQQRVRLDSVLERRSRWKQVYPHLSATFSAVVLGELEIEAGHLLDFRRREGIVHRMELPEYDLRLMDIRIDSARHEDPRFPFYFSDIFFALKDYTFALEDSIHQIKVGKMGISSLARLVYFSDIHMSYDPKVLERLSLARTPNLYRADIPLISLEQTDLFEAIRTRRLEVGEIYIHAPHAELRSFPEFRQALIDSLDAIRSFERPDLYNPISRILNALAVDRFRLTGGTFLLNTENDASENGFTARNISVDILNFVIDSTAQRRTDRYFYADSMNIGINVSDYTYITPDSAYMIRVGNIGVMSATEQIYADSIYLVPRAGNDAAAQFRAFVPRIVLEGLDIQKAYFDKKIEARKLEFRNPALTQYESAASTGTATKIAWDRDSLRTQLRKILLSSYRSIQLQEIDLHSGQWQQMHVTAQDTTLAHAYGGLFAHARGFGLEAAPTAIDRRFLFANDWTLGLRNHRLRTADSLYFFQVDKVALSTGGRQLQVDSIRLIPRYSKEAFALQKGEWVDRMEVSLPRLVLRRLNIDSLLFRQKAIAGRLDIGGLDLRAFKDKRLPEPEDMQPKLLLEQLRSVPLYFRIDTLDLGGAYLEYGEQVPDADEPGVFHIEDLSARVQPFTNDPVLLSSPTVMHISTRSRVMGSGEMRLRFQYLLNDSEGRFRFEGEIDSMSLADFNPMIANTAFFQVNSGQMHKMTFFIDADRKLARGKMRFYYNDLNISFLGNRKRDEGEEPDPRRFASFLANTFMLRSDNPVRRYLRVGKIYFERNERRSIFNYWAHAALSGVKASIGAKNDKDKDKAAGWARKLNPD